MQQRELRVHTLPHNVAVKDLAGIAVVVIDVLRATSTICHALAAGAREVVPFLEVNDALAAAARVNDRTMVVLGGERGGRRIEGFDLGNSPAEYTVDTVAGRRVFLTTTNGTRALHHARLAKRIVVGAFVNLSAVVASLENEPRVDILCAGTDGSATFEDILVAGAIAHRMSVDSEENWRLDDSATIAAHEWGELLHATQFADCDVHELVVNAFRHSAGGANLLEIGHDDDLIACAQIDSLDVVPELDVSKWRITLP